MSRPDAADAVIYEVTLRVDADIASAYRPWLAAHVAQMLALPGFESAHTFDVLEPQVAGEEGVCVQYRLRDAAALQMYLDEHAARMRADGVARFGDRVQASRRVLRARTA